MMEAAYPAIRAIQCIGCLTRSTGAENKIDSTATPYRAPSLLSETVARTCTELILAECEIEELPELIGMYYLLRVLDISDNKLTELPPDLGTCYSLRKLDFSSNQIRVIPDELQTLPYLESIRCHNNKLTVLPDWLGTMSGLSDLNAFNNRVLTIPTSLGQLTKMTTMNLACNVCMKMGDEVMEGWTQLQKLFVYDSRLVTIGKFGHLTQLEQLRLFNNNLTELPDFQGVTLPKLHLVELNHNQISELPLSFFNSLPALKKITLNNNAIESVPSGIDCPLLESFVLGENKLTTVPPDLPLLPALKILFLNGNQLTSLPETFVKAKGLVRVNLAKNSGIAKTMMRILVSIKKATDANKGQYWAPDTLG